MAKAKPGLSVSLEPSPKAGEAITLLAQAQGLTIVDKVTHEAARVFLKGAKALKREIEEHYATIKKPLNEARNTVLDLEKQHLAPVLQAIAVAERLDTNYVREQQRREQEEADRLRREQEERERARRQQEADEAEAQALALEASSNVLSEREQIVVAYMLTKSVIAPTDFVEAARRAKYADPNKAAVKLFDSKKIADAILNGRKAQAIREEAERAKAAPIMVETPAVESQVATVAGTSVRTYYAAGERIPAEAVLAAIAERYRRGDEMFDADVDRYIRPALQTFLNAQARQCRESFEKVWPGCTLVKRDGVTG